MARIRLSTAHGLFDLAAGLWPLVHYRSFVAVTGPKADRWLVQTVAGFSVAVGYALLRSTPSDEGRRTARRLGIGSALAYGLVDLYYGSTGRIRRIYLADAAVEAGWLLAWLAARRR
ncbi:hypothetical protein GCM10022377_20520 [Zhihengliuella alba]|uniref:DUF4345 domain-containing protein n=1 Tax=Zhihengliuella alba TaxID=547018 RepID=A0ABP7DJW0_9MICC